MIEKEILLLVMLIALAKSQIVRGGSYQPPFIGNCLTIVRSGSPVYLVIDELRYSVLWPLMIGLMMVLLTFF